MSSCSAAPSIEFKDSNQQNLNHAVGNSSNNSKGTQENEAEGENEHKDDAPNANYNGTEYEEDDEEEDVDFNPFQREVICPEASSSLSSEVEGLDADVADSGDNVSEVLKGYDGANSLGLPQDCLAGDTEHEALESDLDENMKDDIVEEYEAVDQRPKTRLSRRQKTSVEHKKKVSGESSRPLRPLLPYSPIASYSALAGKGLVPRPGTLCLRPVNDGFINGFTPYQIGQLHCLIHEHVQLLIQIFSICVLDPVRRDIASDIQKLISEMLCKRDEVLAQGRVPYPQFCFFPQHIHPSVAGEAPDVLPGQSTHGFSSASDMQKDCSSVQPSNRTSPSTGQVGYASNEQEGCLRTPEGSSWMPYIGNPTLSVLDVAPLKLVRKFMDDVLSVAQEYQRQPLGATNDVRAEKIPLFPACNIQQSAETDCHAPSSSSVDLTSSSNVQIAKKTLAASLVERAKKESIALVPKEIAKLAQQFYPLFNPTLYPHKAPPAAVVNRVLFTDAEDKLLALGLMEYNTDWKAIQQRFLPCKSKHQIFVRQKNRSSAKAPENPIKAVRRMKNSSLTAEEIARIEEGLRVFKLDWMSVWKFIVPYRDPSLLPRQWRIAIGTQKSYRSDANKKERRRLYESQRRKSKAAALASLHTSEKMDNGIGKNVEDKNSADDCTDKDDEAYVHEAFLADSRAGVSVISATNPIPNLADESRPYPPEMGGSQVGERINESGCRDPLPQINQFPISLKSSNTEVFMRPYRARKSSTARVVKLAPQLPPVNLPPTARVMSQSAFKSYQGVVCTKVSGAKACQDVNATTDNGDLQVASAAKTGLNCSRRDVEVGSITAESNTSTRHQDDESEVLRDRQVVEEKDGPDLQMHPLLFRAPEDGQLLYYPLNSGPNAYSSFNFFPGSPPQLNLSLYRQTNRGFNFFNKALKPKGKASTSCGLGFHPLLQRAADANCVSETANSVAQPSTYSELPRERLAQPPSSLDASRTESCMNNSLVAAHLKPTSPIGNYSEPDLEMHLSLTSRKQKALERCVTDHDVGRSSRSISETEVRSPNTSTLNRMSSNLGSSAQALAVSNEKDIVNNVDDISGQSLPGIVMEQEELSDSEEEEEEEENVEFECEEMADSEGEISHSEQITGGQIEEADRVASDEDSDDHVPVRRGISKENSCNPSQGNMAQLVLRDRERYSQPNSLCLNLNSFPPASPPSKLKDTTSGSVGKMQKPAGSKRSGVNVILDENSAKMEKPAANIILEELNLGSLASSLRKPRKRARRTDSVPNTGGSKKGIPSLNSDISIESSKKSNEGEID
nr:protein argonaute 1B [Ipomoea batatas]